MNEKRIIICRHAESIEDVDNSIYDILNDLEIPLTEKGIEQAHNFGSVLSQLLRNSKFVQFYTSPGVRNVQTLKIVLPKLSDNLNIQIEIEPLIVKQNWGKITAENRPEIEAERYKTGVLRYTFPTGESASNMICRLQKFKEKIFKLQEETTNDIVVFSHGFEFRVLLMIILGWDEELFESFGNLSNCEYRILTREAFREYSLNKSLKKHGFPITRLLGK
ncbi:MAG: histidine phosphatase family protein [Candidatus Parcubacteria bacterium]|nr:histidine phosphatase family protein [Candidatus Parcubacteria bacterium]